MAKSTRNRYGLTRPFNAEQFHGIMANALGYPRRELGKLVAAAMPSAALPYREFKEEFLLREVVRKYPGFDLGIDTRAAALASFREDERLNFITNDRLMSGLGVAPRVSQVIDLAGRKVGKILGRFSWDEFEDGLRFGPGATTSRGHKESSVHFKLQGDNHCTSKALPLWEVCLKTRPLWEAELSGSGACTEIHESDVLLVVPKNARTGRTIGKGPDANVMMQLALGYCLRRRLYYRGGVNLNDQSINQQRALAGSLSGQLSTVDLASASNSVTTGLVYRLLGNLPEGLADPRWYRMLDALRVETVLIDKKRVHRYELFSCMGNGSTFELESLLFYSLAWASCVVLGIEPDVTVYGDDLVVPTISVDLLTEVFSYCGLRVNTDKTFTDPSGGFRESCGKCYLDGRDVTAFYIDEPVTDAGDIFVLANNITRWAKGPSGRDGRMSVVWEWVVSHLPKRLLKFVGPLTEADSHLAMDFDEAHTFVQPIRTPGCAGLSGFSTKGLERVSLPAPVDDRVAYLSALYQGSYRRFTPPNPEKVARIILLPGRQKFYWSTLCGQFHGAAYAGRNKLIKLTIPHVRTEASRDIPVRHVLHEKRIWSPPSWPRIGPWEFDNVDDELRIALLRDFVLGLGESPPILTLPESVP